MGVSPLPPRHEPEVLGTHPPDDLTAAIAAAQGELALAGETRALRTDPYRLVLAGLSTTLSIFGLSVRRWESAVADVIASRDPLPPEAREALVRELADATRRGAYDGVRHEAARLVRTLDQGLVARIGLVVGVAFSAGALSAALAFWCLEAGPFSRVTQGSAVWRELVLHNPDPRQALAASEVRTDHASSRRYYAGVSLWIDPPPAPPPTKAATPAP